MPPKPRFWSKTVHRPGEFLAAAALIVGIAPSALASDAALAEAANKEGSITIYACDPPQTPLYVERFKKLYPKVQVHTYVAGCWQIYNRHASERQAKRQAADVFFATEDVMSRMSSEHLIEPYSSPELVNFAAAAAPSGKDYLIVKTLIYGMASNREFTKGMPMPKDWLDYVEPPAAWQDRVSYYDPRTSSAAFSLLAALYQNFGVEKTGAIYKGLVSVHAALTPTTPAGMSKLLSGEQPIMFYIMNNHFGSVASKGAPIDFHVPASGTPALNFGVGATQAAPHLNAAKLFVDFMLSDAQQIIQKNNEYSLRSDVKPPAGMPAFGELKLMPFDIDRALGDQQNLLQFWQEVTGVK
jgi:iron(III) transport system substrate-binding protein